MDVVLNAEDSRFETAVDGAVGILGFRLEGGRLDLRHTEVPNELEGKGVGSALVRAALDHARSEELTVVPTCPFVKNYLRRHPEAAEGLRVEPVRD